MTLKTAVAAKHACPAQDMADVLQVFTELDLILVGMLFQALHACMHTGADAWQDASRLCCCHAWQLIPMMHEQTGHKADLTCAGHSAAPLMLTQVQVYLHGFFQPAVQVLRLLLQSSIAHSVSESPTCCATALSCVMPCSWWRTACRSASAFLLAPPASARLCCRAALSCTSCACSVASLLPCP